MQEVVCFNCGRIVHISPDAELCSVCGENLCELIHPSYASRYFYDRATTLATGTDLLQAIREVDRGLNYQNSSELRLLGAILSQRIGDIDQMRRHVAAVPVDDILRPEAEWLLRAHQERRREQRNASRIHANPTVSQEDVAPFEEEFDLPLPLTSTAPKAAIQPRSAVRRGKSQVLLGAAFILFLLAVVATGFALTGNNWSSVFPWATTDGTVAGSNGDTETVEPVQQTANDESQPAPILAPTATPAVDVPEDVVEIIEAEPVAQGTLSALIVNPLQPFDLGAYLLENQRPDLADLGVAASSQEGTLLLDGIVPSYLARKDLIDIMAAAPGVNRVSGANLLVRLPPTYTVVEGDTLWQISYEFYGNDHIAEILDANRTILLSPEQLTIGMELTLPEIEQP